MIVVDASVIVTALADNGPEGDAVRTRLQDERLDAPEVVDLEVLSALRRHLLAGRLDARRASMTLDDLADLPLERCPHAPLLRRCWELRHELTPYDASYVALTELLGTTLLTGDRRLAAASGPTCPIEIVTAAEPTG